MVLDTSKFGDWLKQPSTIKAIGAALAGLGFVYTQVDLEKWTAAAVGFSMIVNGLYDNIPRAKPLDLKTLGETLTREDLADIITFYKEKHHVANTPKR
jgi:sulfite exporter TauE/SafE